MRYKRRTLAAGALRASGLGEMAAPGDWRCKHQFGGPYAAKICRKCGTTKTKEQR
jgi:hypothetical protein